MYRYNTDLTHPVSPLCETGRTIDLSCAPLLSLLTAASLKHNIGINVFM